MGFYRLGWISGGVELGLFTRQNKGLSKKLGNVKRFVTWDYAYFRSRQFTLVNLALVLYRIGFHQCFL